MLKNLGMICIYQHKCMSNALQNCFRTLQRFWEGYNNFLKPGEYVRNTLVAGKLWVCVERAILVFGSESESVKNISVAVVAF